MPSYKIVEYNPTFVIFTESVLAAILLQHLARLWTGQAFYKFTEPCLHEDYIQGTSWREELGFGAAELKQALAKVGTHIKSREERGRVLAVTQTDGAFVARQCLVLYWQDKQGRVWYELNQRLLNQMVEFYLNAGTSLLGVKDSTPTDGTTITNNTKNILVNSNTLQTDTNTLHDNLIVPKTISTYISTSTNRVRAISTRARAGGFQRLSELNFLKAKTPMPDSG